MTKHILANVNYMGIMPKNNIIILRPNMTFTEKRKKVVETKILFDKDIQPEFSPGRSVFTETDVPPYKFWKNKRKLIIIGEGSLKAFELSGNSVEIEPHWWTLADAKKFVAQMVAKTKGQQKPISNLQFFVLAGMLAIVILLLFLSLRGGHIAI